MIGASVLVDIDLIGSNKIFESLADWEDYLKSENLDIDTLLADLAKGVVREYVPTYLPESDAKAVSSLSGSTSAPGGGKRTPRSSKGRETELVSVVPSKSGGPL